MKVVNFQRSRMAKGNLVTHCPSTLNSMNPIHSPVGSSRRLVVALIQDDEVTSADRDIGPPGVPLSGVVNVHAVPMQQQLHSHGPALCARNQEAVGTIGQLLQLEARRPGPPRNAVSASPPQV